MSEKFSDPEGYERQLGPRSAALAPLFVQFARVRDRDRVLDAGSGTGLLALALARLRSCREIVGIDPSAPYIDYARTRTSDPRVRFEVGDAMKLPYPDHYFDRSLSQLVLNQLPDAHRAVAEMRRVTRPGGTVAACVWAKEQDDTLSSIFWNAAIALDPDAKAHREAGGGYGRKEKLFSLWSECGLTDVQAGDLAILVDFASFDDFWRPHLTGQARAGAYVKGLPPDRREALRKRLRETILGTMPDGRFSLLAQAVAVKGVS